MIRDPSDVLRAVAHVFIEKFSLLSSSLSVPAAETHPTAQPV